MPPVESPTRQGEHRVRARIVRGVNHVVRPYRPTEMVRDVASIDWKRLNKKGKGLVVVADRDATLLPLWGWDVPEAAKDNIASARSDGTIKELHIGTNGAPRSEIDFIRLATTGDQVDVDLTHVPLHRKWRKPGPIMPLNAVASSQAEGATVVVVGDKLTGDIAAGKKLGNEGEDDVITVLVDKYGKPELFGDRFRRVMERGMKWWMRKFPDDFVEKNPSETPIKVLRRLQSEGIVFTTKPSTDQKYTGKIPDKLWANSKIVGHGAPVVELPQEILDAIPPRIKIPGAKETKKALKALADTKGGKFVEKVIYEHGGLIADWMSLSRVKDGLKIRKLLRQENPNIGKARGKQFWAMVKDALDGFVKKRSKGGADDAGAIYDLIGDRGLDIFSGSGAVAIGRLSKTDFNIRTAREIASFLVRYYYKKRWEVDVKANVVGKASSLIAMPAMNFALRNIAEKKPDLNKKIQRGVTIVKVGSFLYNWWSYHRQVQFKIQDTPKYEEETARLVQKQQDQQGS